MEIKKPSRCHNCKRIFTELPFKCKYCKKLYCSKCRIPEIHNCKPFQKHIEKLRKRWRRPIKLKKYKPSHPIRTIRIEEPKKEKIVKTTNTKDSLPIGWILWLAFFAFIIIVSILVPDESNESLVDYELQFYGSNITPEIKNFDFYYWEDLPISYYFSGEYPCSGDRKERVLQALQIIEEETDNLATFQEKKQDKAIEIICSAKLQNEERAGEGGIENYVGEKEILKATVILYRRNSRLISCLGYPSLELHEILHAFGFGHISNPYSIMNPIEERCNRIDPRIINCLKHIYSDGQIETCDGVPMMSLPEPVEFEVEFSPV